MKRLHLGRSQPAPPAPAVEVRAVSWREKALDSAGLWLRIVDGLRVVEASPAADVFFAAPTLPTSLVAVTRSASAENFARLAVGGQHGPWDFDAAHFKCLLRMRAVSLGPDGTLLVLEDITELRRLESMRADFVANLAHEMRTPVASLSLAAETLSTDLPPREQRRFIERIAEETQYIAGLLRSVSELALLESEVELSLSTFVLHDVVAETWRRVTDRQGPGELSNQVPPQMLLTADRVRVAEVLQNLVENAHRFSHGSVVAVGAHTGDAEIEVWVADNGPGIPPRDLSRIFERFYKVDRARTRRGDGSGLGLAIAKHLVSAHNGRIWAAAAESGGTRITFTLPVTKRPQGDSEQSGTGLELTPAPGTPGSSSGSPYPRS